MHDSLFALLALVLGPLSIGLIERTFFIVRLRKAGAPGLTGKLVWTVIGLFLALSGLGFSLLFLVK